MKFYVISDNIDTLMGMRLAGIEGEVVHSRRHFLEVLESKMGEEDIAIILLTTKVIEFAPEVVSELKLRQLRPLLTEIPDRHGHSRIGETLDRYVADAIGMSL